jgi:hypothetical protein
MSSRADELRASVRVGFNAAFLGFAVLLGIVVWWTWRTFHDPHPMDLGLAYQAGRVALITGHPERLNSWDGTPFLGASMAVISRFFSQHLTWVLLTVLNLAAVLALAGVLLGRLRGIVSARWWWVLAFAVLSFSPLMSTVWTKQFNILALALAVGGFELLRRGQDRPAAFLIGLSISLKPLVFLVPFVLLVPRSTRRVALETIAWVIVLNVLGLILYAIRAHSLDALNPYTALQTFEGKAGLSNTWACAPDNFAPGALQCRLSGINNPTLQQIVVYSVVALFGVWAVDVLRGRGPRSWEVLAFAAPLSAMLSPLQWSHYQVLLLPLFVLLVVRFLTEGATFGAWAGLASAFFLASLMWQPYGTLVGAVRGVFSGMPQTPHDLQSIGTVAQFAQYTLLITALVWYAAHRRMRAAAPEASPGAG